MQNNSLRFKRKTYNHNTNNDKNCISLGLKFLLKKYSSAKISFRLTLTMYNMLAFDKTKTFSHDLLAIGISIEESSSILSFF